MHEAQPNAVKPSAATDKRVRRIPHRVKENRCCPLLAEGFNYDLVPTGTEGTGDSSIFPLDSGLGESQDICVGIVEDTVRRPGVQPGSQLNASIAVLQPHRYENCGRRLIVIKLAVEFERDQSSHPPANGCCSSGETKIKKGEESPFAVTSS